MINGFPKLKATKSTLYPYRYSHIPSPETRLKNDGFIILL